jgi:hypothetical protein
MHIARLSGHISSGLLSLIGLGLCSALVATPAFAKERKEREGIVPEPQPVGLLQVYGTVWDQDTDPLVDPAGYGDPEDDTGFKIRRAWFGLSGKSDEMRYDLLVGYASSNDLVRPVTTQSLQFFQADASYRPVKGLWITGGFTVVPVSREFLMSGRDLALADRAVSTFWMTPNRDVGIVLDGRLGELKSDGFRGRLRAGVFNGNRQLGGDDNPGKLVTVRAEGIVGPGEVYQTWGKVDGVTVGFAGNFWNNDNLSNREMGYGGDVLFRVAGFALLSEVAFANIEPQDTDIAPPELLVETPRVGAFVQAGYSVWRVEPVVRWSTFDDNRNFEDNGDVSTMEGGVAWHGPKDAIKAGAMYVHRAEPSAADGKAVELANDSARLWLQVAF